jgi:hypothetical protein
MTNADIYECMRVCEGSDECVGFVENTVNGRCYFNDGTKNTAFKGPVRDEVVPYANRNTYLKVDVTASFETHDDHTSTTGHNAWIVSDETGCFPSGCAGFDQKNGRCRYMAAVITNCMHVCRNNDLCSGFEVSGEFCYFKTGTLTPSSLTDSTLYLKN